jgi:hypothetical protein
MTAECSIFQLLYLLSLREQEPQGDPTELDEAELASVRLFQQNTPSVVNISNISERNSIMQSHALNATLSYSFCINPPPVPIGSYLSISNCCERVCITSNPTLYICECLRVTGEVRSRQGRYMSMDTIKMPVGSGSGLPGLASVNTGSGCLSAFSARAVVFP